MHVATLLVLSTLIAEADASGPAYWIEGETYYSQVGSMGSDRPPFASGGECLGSNWGGGANHSVVYRFFLDRGLDEATLHLRYARLDEGPSHFDLFCDNRRLAERMTLENTGGWGHRGDNEWRFHAVKLGALGAGWHEVKFVSLADKNNTNLDGFFIAGPDFQPPVVRSSIEALPRAQVRVGPNAPGSDWVDARTDARQILRSARRLVLPAGGTGRAGHSQDAAAHRRCRGQSAAGRGRELATNHGRHRRHV